MRRKILIVDDEPMIALDLEASLTNAGFEVVGIACTIKEVLASMESAPCDLVVLDAMLRDQSAGPLAKHLREAGIAFVVASGHSAKQIDWLEDEPLIQKPFDQAQLLAGIGQVLEQPNK
jgi:DNA-binding response OmpR family regulator